MAYLINYKVDDNQDNIIISNGGNIMKDLLNLYNKYDNKLQTIIYILLMALNLFFP